MDLMKKDSSCIAAIRETGEMLEVHFRNGGCYRYCDVPSEVISEMREAVSLGAFFNEHVRNEYVCFKQISKEGVN